MFGEYDYILFGVSWIAVGSVLVALVRKYAPRVSEDLVKVGAAFWVVIGFFIDKLYVGDAWVIPTAPEAWIALSLRAVIIFGAVLGLAPGNTFGRGWRVLTRRQ